MVMLPPGPVRSERCPSLSLLLMPLLLACVKYRSNGLRAVRQLCLIQTDWPVARGTREKRETACLGGHSLNDAWESTASAGKYSI